MLDDVLRDFRAEGEVEAAIWEQLQGFVARYGAAALGSEIADAIGHVTVSAWILCPGTSQLLLVFGRKESVWKLPGAHCEGDLRQTALDEATRALGSAPLTQNPALWALGEREIAEYWQTPAHRHFELIFRFEAVETRPLPRGAKWFSEPEIALLGDANLARLLQKPFALTG